ncbi:MAG: hypothetical protein NZ914_08615 [Gemmatales bacterium]|nr:hypothetical protein [Gemmatales bacterium]
MILPLLVVCTTLTLEGPKWDTNGRPIARFIGLKRYELVYTEDDLPTHYSFQGEYGIPALMKEVEHLQRVGRQRFLDQSKRPITRQALRSRLDQLEPKVRTILQTQDPEGRWLNNHEIRMATFIRNMETLAEYLETYAVWKDSEQY